MPGTRRTAGKVRSFRLQRGGERVIRRYSPTIGKTEPAAARDVVEEAQVVVSPIAGPAIASVSVNTGIAS
jgi:hypothetical protein